MASSGSSVTGSGSYGGSAAGKGGYSGSGTGKGSYSFAGAGSYGKGDGYLTNYSKGIGTGYLSNLLSSYFKAKAGSSYRDSRGVKGDDQKDSKSFLELILRGRQPLYYTVDLKKKRLIDLEEYLEKENKKYKKKCPNCGIDVLGVSYSMN